MNAPDHHRDNDGREAGRLVVVLAQSPEKAEEAGKGKVSAEDNDVELCV